MVHPPKRTREGSENSGDDRAKQVPKRTHTSALSHNSLEQHNQIVDDDHNFAESAARAESSQMFHRALYRWQTEDADGGTASPPLAEDWSQQPQFLEVNSTLAHVSRMHKPAAASSASPLQRYLTMDGASDPFHPYGRKALSDMGLDFGSLASIETRTRAAKLLADGVLSVGEETASSELYIRRARSAPTVSRPRMHRQIVQRSPLVKDQDDEMRGAKRTKTA